MLRGVLLGYMVQAQESINRDGSRSVGSSFIVTEVDLIHSGREVFNDGADLTPLKALFG